VSKWLVQALPDAHRAASVAHSPCVVSSAFGPMLWRAVRRERRGLTCACCHGDGTARARRSQRLRRVPRGGGALRSPCGHLSESGPAGSGPVRDQGVPRVRHGRPKREARAWKRPTEARVFHYHANRGMRDEVLDTCEVDVGNPFAAWPEPDILTNEVRAHFRLLRNGGRASVASASRRCGRTRQPSRHPSSRMTPRGPPNLEDPETAGARSVLT
jgi:hypothetical protein